MIQTDAELLLYKEPWGARAEWKGGRYAKMRGEMFVLYNAYPPAVGRQFKAGGVSLQIIEEVMDDGLMWDYWVIARAEDPVAWLKAGYRRMIYAALGFSMRCERAALAFRHKYKEGARARFTGWLADRLL